MRERIGMALVRTVQAPVEGSLRRSRIRRMLHRRALRAWRTTPAPLILCYGNINRSPFAAALARRQTGKQATSAGFYPVAGRGAPEPTIELAATYGVDLVEHRSRTVTDAELEHAAAIFVFDLENLALLASRRPTALARTHLLGTLSAAGVATIVDPHAKSAQVLGYVLQTICRAISAAA